MNYKRWSAGLGIFSMALGAAELLAARRIAKALSAGGRERLIRGFGAREVAAGTALLLAPAHSTRMWGRVAGDVADLGALGLAVRRAPKNKALMGAIAFVVGATALDLLVARGLDRKTGKAAPKRQGSGTGPDVEKIERVDPHASAGATSIEPAHVAHAEPPSVAVAPA